MPTSTPPTPTNVERGEWSSEYWAGFLFSAESAVLYSGKLIRLQVYMIRDCITVTCYVCVLISYGGLHSTIWKLSNNSIGERHLPRQRWDLCVHRMTLHSAQSVQPMHTFKKMKDLFSTTSHSSLETYLANISTRCPKTSSVYICINTLT